MRGSPSSPAPFAGISDRRARRALNRLVGQQDVSLLGHAVDAAGRVDHDLVASCVRHATDAGPAELAHAVERDERDARSERARFLAQEAPCVGRTGNILDIENRPALPRA